MKKLFLNLTFILFSLTFISADLSIDTTISTIDGVQIEIPISVLTNVSNETVNHSNSTFWWVTSDLGAINAVSSIGSGDITDEGNWRTITNGSFTFDVALLEDVEISGDLSVFGTASSFNGSLLIDASSITDGNATLVIMSDNNKHSCINLTEGGTLGFQICNDGEGSNRLVFSSMDDGFEWMWINRDDGTINFLNNTIFTTINVTTLNVTGNSSADFFVGDGSFLTGINTTNLSYVLRAGDIMTGNLDMSQNNVTDISDLIGGDATADDLNLWANDNAFVEANSGRIKLHERVEFTGITSGATSTLIKWSETFDATGFNILTPRGFDFSPTIQYDTSQAFAIASAFDSTPTWDEVSAIGDPHLVFAITGFLATPEVTMSHGGTFKSPTSFSGYLAEPMLNDGGAGGGTMTVNTMEGFTTNPQNALRSFFGAQQIKGGTVTTYSHFKANSQGQLLLALGGSITTEIGLDLANINVGTTKISLRSTGTSASMVHAGNIQIKSDSNGVIIGADPTNDWKMMSTGQNGATVFNSLNKNIDLIYRSNAGGTILRIDADLKRVGIRTDSPLATFVVEGDSRFGDQDASRTQITATGTISQIGTAVAFLHTTTIGTSSNLILDSDETGKFFLGDSQDVSINFNGADWIFNAEVGTPNVNWTGFTSYNFDNNMNVDGNINITGFYIGEAPEYVAYSNLSQSIPQNSYALITIENIVDAENITSDGQNFTIGFPGHYEFALDLMTSKTAGITTTQEAILFKNGNQLNGTARQRTVNSNNEVGFFALDWGSDAVTGDVYSFGIASSGTNGLLASQGCVACEANVSVGLHIVRSR